MNCFILRGVSGSGKSTFASTLASNMDAVVCTADDFFYENGHYKFDADKLADAHEQCQQKFLDALKEKKNVIVANTNTWEKEFSFYINEARRAKYRVFSLVVENRHGNKSVHNVPSKTLEKQKVRIKNSLNL